MREGAEVHFDQARGWQFVADGAAAPRPDTALVKLLKTETEQFGG